MVGSLIILLIFSLAVQKLLNLMLSYLFIFYFVSLVPMNIVKILPHGIKYIFKKFLKTRKTTAKPIIIRRKGILIIKVKTNDIETKKEKQ